MAEAIYRKYRPSTFADVTGQVHVTRTILNQLGAGTAAHAYLFTGPRGVGKTTTARLIAKAVNCEGLKDGEPCNTCSACEEILNGSSLDVYEIDAASHTGVDNVRENIIENVRFTPNRLKKKVFIIDEVHMLSTGAFNALLKTLEEPPDHAVFVLATTEIHKVPATIISRCQRFDFKRIPVAEMIERLKRIVKDEKVSVDDDVLAEIARHADGCARDAESLLGQVLALGEKKITMEVASLVLPATNTVLVADFVTALVARDAKKAIGLIQNYVEQGVDMPTLANESVDMVRNLLLTKMGDNDALSGYPKELQEQVGKLEVDIAYLSRVIEMLLQTRRDLKSENIPQLGLELAVVKLSGGAVPTVKEEPEESFFEQPGGSVSDIKEEKQAEAPPVILSDNEGSEPVSVEEPPVTEESPAEKPAPAGIPVIALDDVKKRWPTIFEKVKECNASLPFVIQTGEVHSVEGDEVHLAFQYQLHADQVNTMKNRQILEGVFETVLGKKVRVRGKYLHQEADEAVSALVEEFGGSVQ